MFQVPERFVNLPPYISQRQISKEEDGAVLYDEGRTYPRSSGYRNEEDSRIGNFYGGERGWRERMEGRGDEQRMAKRGEQVDEKTGMR